MKLSHDISALVLGGALLTASAVGFHLKNAVAIPTHCVSTNGLPDAQCTPGVIDPTKTKAILCDPSYTTKAVRPSVSYTTKLKLAQMKQYGYADTNLSHYEEDHLISLELGGSPDDPKNLWPEPGASPNPKDAVENRCHFYVCHGIVTLQQAQQQIATNWHTACL